MFLFFFLRVSATDVVHVRNHCLLWTKKIPLESTPSPPGFLLSLVLLEANPGMVSSAYSELELLLLFLLEFLVAVEAVLALIFISDARV